MKFRPDDQDIPELAAFMRERGIQYMHASINEDACPSRADVAAELLASQLRIERNEVFTYPALLDEHRVWVRWLHRTAHWLLWKAFGIRRTTTLAPKPWRDHL